jgi:hypothetical protein
MKNVSAADSNVQMFGSNVQMIQMFKCSNVQMIIHKNLFERAALSFSTFERRSH